MSTGDATIRRLGSKKTAEAAEVVKSRDTRLWEGIPVLLANAADTYQFAYDLVEKQFPPRMTRLVSIGSYCCLCPSILFIT